MRIAYVTSYDANDLINWSGTGNAILRSLREAGCEVDPIGPLALRGRLIGRLKGRFYRLRGQIFDFERGPIPTTGYARQIAAKLKGGQHDIVFCPGAVPISRLDCEKPIVIWADATFESLINLRSSLHGKGGICAETIRDGHKTDRSAFDRCALLIFASDWAAKSAMDHYGVNRRRSPWCLLARTL
jgi:hypothetical protein